MFPWVDNLTFPPVVQCGTAREDAPGRARGASAMSTIDQLMRAAVKDIVDAKYRWAGVCAGSEVLGGGGGGGEGPSDTLAARWHGRSSCSHAVNNMARVPGLYPGSDLATDALCWRQR